MALLPKLVVISGASRGIGLGFGRELLRRSSESTIIAASRGGVSPGLEALQAEYGTDRVIPMACDITSQEQCKQMAAKLKGDLGGQKIDMLLNVAGVLHEQGTSGLMPERSLSSIDADAMQRVIATNAMGPVLVTQALAPQLGKKARIGNVSARVGSISDNRLGGWWSYRMSKAALNMATVNMALELKRKEIIAVALHPGTTDTGLSEPFQKNVRPEKLFTTEYSASSMLDVLLGLELEDSGKFFAYDGSLIEY
jgi:NAD(P)-dependent dehydrogenase (short-subunit alcohol dehydrogenase family)